MKTLIYLLIAMTTITSCKERKAEKEPDIQYTNFPGTDIYIQLPKGFAWLESAMGFVKDEDGSVINYDEFKTIQSKANMPVEETVATFIKERPVIISGNKGKIKTYQLGSTGIQLELSFTNGEFMEYIAASYFSNRVETGKEIEVALENIQIRKSTK